MTTRGTARDRTAHGSRGCWPFTEIGVMCAILMCLAGGKRRKPDRFVESRYVRPLIARYLSGVESTRSETAAIVSRLATIGVERYAHKAQEGAAATEAAASGARDNAVRAALDEGMSQADAARICDIGKQGVHQLAATRRVM